MKRNHRATPTSRQNKNDSLLSLVLYSLLDSITLHDNTN